MAKNTKLEESDLSDDLKRAVRRKLPERGAKWIAETLKNTHKVTKADYEEYFKSQDTPVGDDDWSRTSRAVQGALEGIGQAASFDDDGAIVLSSDPEARFENRQFKPSENSEQKSRIGWLVAHYLKHRQDRNVMLGSGSTVFHVGKCMCAIASHRNGGPYQQLFWTVNIALAAMWCEKSIQAPVARVQIPKGELRTRTFRYESMDPPKWNCPIAVVGADGCYFHNDKAALFANEDSIATNTNVFMSSALDSVICCIVSDKLKYVQNEGQNAGPPLENPPPVEKRGGVKWYLVTDKLELDKKGDPVDNPKLERLKVNGWNLVSELSHWSSTGDTKSIAPITEFEPLW